MTSLFLRLPGGVDVRVEQAPADLERHLRSRLPLFAGESFDGGSPAILVRAARPDELTGTGEWEADAPYGMIPVLHGGRRAIACRRRGQVDHVIVPDEPIELHFRARGKCARRVYGALLVALHAALLRRRAALLHAAAATREDRCVLLVGFRGSRKSQILFTLLREGWGYLADDKVILADGRVHLFQTLVGLADHHLSALPWLAWRSSAVGRRVRSALSALSGRVLPRQFLPAASKVLDPITFLDVHDLFPGCPVVRETAIHAVALLGPAESPSVTPLAREEALRELACVQDLMFHDLEPLPRLLAALSPVPLPLVAEVAAASLPPRVRFVRVGLPPRLSPEEAARAVASLAQDA